MTGASDPLDDLAIGYVLPTEQEIAEIWSSATVVLDANVLLNVYRYSPAARDELLKALESVRDRVFVPHQAALEYFKNRVPVISEQFTAKEKMLAGIDDAVRSLLKTLEETHSQLGRRDKPSEMMNKARERLSSLRDELMAAEDSWLSDVNERTDDLHSRVATLIRGRVGAPFADARMAELGGIAKTRIAAKIPPGYADADKDDGGVGDVILWQQVLEHAADRRTPVIIVTDDTKKDWLWIVRGRTLGPRPELARELHTTAGVRLGIYTTARFLSLMSEQGSTPIDPAVLAEAATREAALDSPVARGAEAGAFLDALRAAFSDPPPRPAPSGLQVLPTVSGRTQWEVQLSALILNPMPASGLSCRVEDPLGNQFVWISRPDPPRFTRILFPSDFEVLVSDDEEEVAAGEYTAVWNLTDDEFEESFASAAVRFVLPVAQ